MKKKSLKISSVICFFTKRVLKYSDAILSAIGQSSWSWNSSRFFAEFLWNIVEFLQNALNSCGIIQLLKFLIFVRTSAGILRKFFKNSTGIRQGFFRDSAGILQEFFRNSLEILKSLSHSLGILLEYFKNYILGIPQ